MTGGLTTTKPYRTFRSFPLTILTVIGQWVRVFFILYIIYIHIYLIYLLIYYKLKVATNGILSMFLLDHWKKTHLELLCLTRECTRIALPLYRRKTKARTNAGCELMGGGKHGKQALHCSIQCMMCYIFSIYHPQDLNCANIPALKLHAQNKTNFYLRAHTCEI